MARRRRRPVLASGRLVVLGAKRERREYRSGVPARRLPTDEDRVAAMHGLLGGLLNGDDVGWWQSDDFWHYALHAAVLWISASAARLDVSVAELCQRIAASHDLALPSTE